MPNRTPTEAEVRASIRAEMERRNAAVTPAQRSAAIRAREQGYGAAGSPYAETEAQRAERLRKEEAAKRRRVPARRGKSYDETIDEMSR